MNSPSDVTLIKFDCCICGKNKMIKNKKSKMTLPSTQTMILILFCKCRSEIRPGLIQYKWYYKTKNNCSFSPKTIYLGKTVILTEKNNIWLIYGKVHSELVMPVFYLILDSYGEMQCFWCYPWKSFFYKKIIVFYFRTREKGANKSRFLFWLK